MKTLPFLALALLAVPALAQTKVKSAPGQQPVKQTFGIPDKAKMEIVFVVDTTGSMGGLIDGAKKTIWSIVNDVSAAQPKPEIKIGFVAYRDKGDAYVTQDHELTGDLDSAFATLQKFAASGGGDTPEHVSAGLHDAVSKMNWSAGGSADKALYQVIFLVGDAPPHTDYKDGMDYKVEADKAAQKGIFVNTIRCGGDMDTEKVWLDIAKRGQGNYFSIAETGGVVSIDTPFDSEMVKLGAMLETTTIARRGMESARNKSLGVMGLLGINGPVGLLGYGGSAAPSAATTRALAASGSVYADSGKENYIARQAFNAKSGQIYGAFDLVTDVANGRKISDIKDTEWPADLQKKPLAERRALLEKKVSERKDIQAKLISLETKRNAFLRAQADKSGASSGFDQKMVRSLKKQATRNGFKY